VTTTVNPNLPGGGTDAAALDAGHACVPDSSACGSSCVDLGTDPANCGSCGHTCGAGTACVASQCTPVDTNILSYRVLDAAYSRTVDRAVIVTDSPNAVHLLDPHTMNDVAIALPAAPTSVAVSPDGKHAAVGHDAFVSYVDLVARSIVKTFPVSAPVGFVAVSDGGYVYAIPSADQWVSLYILDVATGTVTMTGPATVYAGTYGVVSIDNTTLFLADRGSSPSELYRYDISNPIAPVEKQMFFGDTYPVCGTAWISKDDSRVYTACGNVFHASDLTYDGSLASLARVVSVDDFSPDGTVAALGTTSNTPVYPSQSSPVPTAVQTYSATYLQPVATLPLPPLAAPGGAAASDGLFVFHDAAGTGTVVLLHASDPVSKVDIYGVAVLH
jgi:hypothetical protein